MTQRTARPVARLAPALPALALLAGLLPAPPARASGGGPELPWTVDPYGGSAADQRAFHDGEAGILPRAAPFARLFAAWRLLHRLPVGAEAGAGLAVPCCDASPGLDAARAAWLAARTRIPDAAPIAFIATDRSVGDFVSVPTCFADAFRTAARTLTDRLDAHADAPAALRSWRDAQDVVFANCTDAPAPPAPAPDPSAFAPLPADAPDWLQQDRAEQEAARHLYRREFADARAAFEAIAADPASPWRPMAPYLAVRATVAAALPSRDPAILAAAADAVAALPAPAPAPASAPGAPPGTAPTSTRPGAPPAAAPPVSAATLRALRDAIEFRLHPDARRAALAAELSGPSLPGTAAADFKDSRRLGHPAEIPYLDWLTVMGRAPNVDGLADESHYAVESVFATDAAALDHARQRWAATADPAWLLALLQAAAPGPGSAGLVAASRAIAPADPAHATALYHRARLTLAADPDAARAELDVALARPGQSTTTRNLFQAERALLATGPADLAARAMREPPCREDPNVSPPGASPPTPCAASAYGIEGLPDPAAPPRLGPETADIIDRMSLALRTRMLAEPLPDPVRLDIALTTWTRAVLAGDDAAATALVPALRTLLPRLAADWTATLAARPGEDRRFAAWFILAKLPGAAIDLDNPDHPYTRPVGALADFDGAWPDWTYAPAGQPAPPAAAPVPPKDPVCFGLCGSGAFPLRLPDFVAADAAAAATERGRFSPPATAPAGHVWEDVLAYARAHPADPRSPEALYWLVRVSRFGKGHDRSGFRAFTLLHARYAKSPWTRRTPYFFD